MHKKSCSKKIATNFFLILPIKYLSNVNFTSEIKKRIKKWQHLIISHLFKFFEMKVNQSLSGMEKEFSVEEWLIQVDRSRPQCHYRIRHQSEILLLQSTAHCGFQQKR